MRTLSVFDQVSVDGYLADEQGDMSWAHRDDPEWLAYMASNARGGGALVFGRITYELMSSYWPTPAAREANPEVADRMTSLEKLVFSRTLGEPTWENTRVIRGDLAGEVRALKAQPGPDMVILGSGSIVAQLTEARLIDEYQIVMNPLILGRGTPLFAGLDRRLRLTLEGTRAFGNGNVLLRYRAAA